jgi:hypothetical protein
MEVKQIVTSEQIKCSVKHTVFQCKGDETWACPICGATPKDKSGGFVIEEPDENSHSDCNLLHDNDECRCYECGYGADGKAVAKALTKKANACVCPLCMGKGTIDKTKGTAMISLVDAVNLALTLETAGAEQLLVDGWKEDSMPVQACRSNILKYKAALEQAMIFKIQKNSKT